MEPLFLHLPLTKQSARRRFTGFPKRRGRQLLLWEAHYPSQQLAVYDNPNGKDMNANANKDFPKRRGGQNCCGRPTTLLPLQQLNNLQIMTFLIGNATKYTIKDFPKRQGRQIVMVEGGQLLVLLLNIPLSNLQFIRMNI